MVYPLNSNPWQYSIYPFGISRSVMSPSDAMSNNNDKKLFSFNANAEAMLQQTSYMQQMADLWAQQYQAQVSQWWQNMMSNMSSNTNININGANGSIINNGTFPFNMNNPVNGTNPVNGVNDNNDELDDTAVWKYMARLRFVDTFGEKFTEKISKEDGTKTTYEEMLVKLCKDYVTEEEPELSETEFAQCKDIAKKLKSTGQIDKSDWLTLKSIVEAHLGKASGDGDDDGDGTSNGDGDSGKVARNENYCSVIANPTSYNAPAQDLFDAIDGPCTDKGKLDVGTDATNKYNVIEVLTAFEKKSNSKNSSFIERLLDDCDNWTENDTDWWCLGMDQDASKKYVEHFADCMTKRAKDLIKLPNCTTELKKELEDAYKSLNNYIEELSNSKEDDDDLNSNEKKELAKRFDALKDRIKNAEEQLYCEIE